MKRALVAVLLMLFVPQAFAANTWLKSVKAAQEKAKKGNQLILVDLYAAWCGWCHRFEQEVYPAETFQKATEDIVLLKLDTEDGGEGTQFAQKYGVSSLPTFVLLNPDLSIAGIIKGYAPAPQFVQLLKDTRTKNDTFQKRLRNEATLVKDPADKLDLARELTRRQAFAQSESRLRKLTADKGIPAGVRDQAYYELAVAQVMQKKYDSALGTIKTFGGLQSSGDAYERSRLLIGQIKMERGDIAGAVDEFRKFKSSFPQSPLVRNVDMVLPDLERQLAPRR